MKKIIAFLALAACMLMASCQKEIPAFDMDVGGAVIETTTNISATFDVATANVSDGYFTSYEIGEYDLLTAAKCKPAYRWLIKNVKKPILSKYDYSAKYDIYVKGFIQWHGLKFTVDEHWNNTNAIALNSAYSNDDVAVVWLPKEKRRYANTDNRYAYYPTFDYVGY